MSTLIYSDFINLIYNALTSQSSSIKTLTLFLKLFTVRVGVGVTTHDNLGTSNLPRVRVQPFFCSYQLKR